MDQLTLAFTPPGIGHNHPPERIDPIDGLNTRLTATHADLVARFHDLELACGQVPDPIATEVDVAARPTLSRSASSSLRMPRLRANKRRYCFCASVVPWMPSSKRAARG